MKSVELLNVADIMANPVWEFVDDDRDGDIVVRPVAKLPASNLSGKIVGVRVELANHCHVWALIGNVASDNGKLTEHFLTLTIERDGRWFHLARYFDSDYDDHGPKGLAHFLGLPVEDVFPISYDIKCYAKGDTAALSGKVLKEPRKRLTREEIIAMAVPKRKMSK